MKKSTKNKRQKIFRKFIIATMFIQIYKSYKGKDSKTTFFAVGKNQLVSLSHAVKLLDCTNLNDEQFSKRVRLLTKITKFIMDDKEFETWYDLQDTICEKCGYTPIKRKRIYKDDVEWNADAESHRYEDGRYPEITFVSCEACGFNYTESCGIDKNNGYRKGTVKMKAMKK